MITAKNRRAKRLHSSTLTLCTPNGGQMTGFSSSCKTLYCTVGRKQVWNCALNKGKKKKWNAFGNLHTSS